MRLYQGVVENRQDPMQLGRCQVRVVGLHTHDKIQLKTEDLPWAYPMQPVTSAAMSGIGHSPVGPVEGTWVVIMFRDEDEQYPVILGTLGGISQAFTSVDQDPNGVLLKDEQGNTPSSSSDVVSSSSPGLVTVAKELTPQQQAQNVLQPGTNPTTATITTDIPTTPPKGTPDVAKATAGIKAILAACEKYGLKTREQKCSLLAIAGGESLWVPKEEMYSYSAEGLMNTFKSTFGGKPGLADQWSRAPKKGISREQFFDFVYAPENNGRQLGNTQTGDGGKYYGRGFNGITGRANYDKFGKLAGVDIINNPFLMSTDIKLAAEIFCLMVTNNPVVKKATPTANPGYFYAVKKGNGHDTGTGAEIREKYYEYFYGTVVESSFTQEKSADPAPTPVSANSTIPTEKYITPAPSPSSPGPIGFRDPHNKYPLKDHLYEPDTNRLARGVKKGTVHPRKDANRAQGIAIALSSSTFSEPLSSFSAKYPYNHVMETESGHVQEFDDTPNHERIMTYHRKGTFTEIDPNGSSITHVVGDNYHIIDRNGCISIAGEANLTVNGNINILCKATTNIEVTGDANVEVGNNANIGVAKDVDMVVGQNMKLQVDETLDIKAKAINIQADTTMNIKADTMNETAATMNVSAEGVYNETVGESSYRWQGDRYTLVGANTYSRHESGTDFSCPSDPSRSGSTACPSVTVATDAPDVNTELIAPEEGVLNSTIIEYLIAPPSEGEETFLLETEEEWQSAAGVAAVAALAKEYGSETPENTPAQESTAPKSGSNVTIVAPCTIVNGVEIFTNDFRLSPNFTLGMLIDGGVNGKNQLRDQLGLTKQQIVCNLSQLCVNILEPMLAVLPNGIAGYGKTWKINSGFRVSTNIPAGGVAKSDHMLGRAIDFTLLPYDSIKAQRNYEFCSTLSKILPYDQIIMEYMSGGSNWIHIGYRGIKEGDTAGGGYNRKMAFTMLNGSTYRRDDKGQPSGFYLL